MRGVAFAFSFFVDTIAADAFYIDNLFTLSARFVHDQRVPVQRAELRKTLRRLQRAASDHGGGGGATLDDANSGSESSDGGVSD